MTTPNDPNAWTGLHKAFAELHEEAATVLKAHQDAGALDMIHVLLELERRIWQLGWGLHQIDSVSIAWRNVGIQDAISTLVTNNSRPELTELSFLGGFAVEYLCDAFYVMAFRVYKLLEKKKGLAIKAEGVNRVRNKMIIHPEEKDGVVPYSFGGGGGVAGPVYKPGQTPEQAAFFTDPGLIANAHEFASQLLESLKNYPRPHRQNP